MTGLPITSTFKLYEEDPQSPASGLAVFDQGSLPLQGATGIAELSDTGGCTGHTWPVARHGNDLFWGYALPGTALTPEGTRLFTNVVLAVLQDEFQKPLQQQHYKVPGSYNGDGLGCMFSTNEYRLSVSDVGAINVVVRSKDDILVTVTGPRPSDTYSAHGISPKVLVPVTRQAMDAGEDWVVTITYSGPMSSRTRINYDLTLSYPNQVSSPAMAAWLALFLLLTCLLGVVSTFYLIRSRPVFRSWARSVLSILPFRR